MTSSCTAAISPARAWSTSPTRRTPVELAWSDPPPIVPTDLGGAWSSYWYNDYIYETNITEGLNIFQYTGPKVNGNFNLAYLNPQTQEFTIKAKRGKSK